MADLDPYATTSIMQTGNPLPHPTYPSDPAKPSGLSCFNGKPKPFQKFPNDQQTQGAIARACSIKGGEVLARNLATGEWFWNRDPGNTDLGEWVEIGIISGACDDADPKFDFETGCQMALNYILNTCKFLDLSFFAVGT